MPGSQELRGLTPPGGSGVEGQRVVTGMRLDVQPLGAGNGMPLLARKVVLCVEPRYVLFEEGVYLWFEGLWIVEGVEVKIDLVSPAHRFVCDGRCANRAMAVCNAFR
jgi:hypothetical protein